MSLEGRSEPVEERSLLKPEGLDDDGHVLVSGALDPHARSVLGLDKPLQARSLDAQHRSFLKWHQERLFSS